MLWLQRAVFLAPVAVWTYVSARMNLRLADTLGTDDLTRECFWWLGLAAAAYAGLGLELTRLLWKQGAPSKSVAAFVLLLLAAGYDAMAAYATFNREGALVDHSRAEIAERKAAAKAKVDTAKDALQPYAKAPELGAAEAALEALKPTVREERCKLNGIPDDEKARCAQLTAARIALANAGAKVRLAAELEKAEAEHARLPDPPPADARARDLGEWARDRYPVVLLQLGALLGAYAAFIPKLPKPAAPQPTAPAPAPIPQRQRASAGIAPPQAEPIASPPPATTGDLVAALSALMHDPASCPKGVKVDRHGWLSGPQRPLAAKLGVPVSRFNREVRAAAAAGALELDTSGPVTRLRLCAMGRS